ncbi:PREDICTED: YLS9 [Prunus dulcis]|uniref:PREDICTED: YLS9 n=2 Tax=Prunus dulcis TaxID=3755 RepID=A0A5E4GQ32_PRUDU|nr:PREDICTED: YLS9 [Prunus dulcis]
MVGIFACMCIHWYFMALQDRWLDVRFPEFRLDSVVVSPCPLTPSLAVGGSSNNNSWYLTATWDLSLVFINPNHILGVSYDNFRAGLLYGDEEKKDKLILSMTPLPLPPLNKMSQTTINFSLAMVRSYVGEDMANELLMGGGSDGCYGAARLGVKLFGKLTFMVPPQGSFRDLGSQQPVTTTRKFCGLSPPHYNGTGQGGECEGFPSQTPCRC